MSRSTLIIEPTRGWRSLSLGELWSYRELLVIFAWRDIRVRYRQTLLGAAWVMGQPLVTMLIFTILFDRIARLSTGVPVPYPVFVLSGILIWNLIGGGIGRAGNSMLGAGHLISKVYFPRLLIPLSTIATDVVDALIASVLLIPLMVWYGVEVHPTVVLAPAVMLLAALLALGAGLWVAAINVKYRDVRVVMPWVLQIAMFVTPVVYPVSAVPPRYRWIAVMNPASGVIEAFRGVLFGTDVIPTHLLWSIVVTAVLLITGALYFRRMERLFADLL